MIDRIRTTLNKRGPGGILGLGKQFRIADKNDNRSLERDEFVYGMRDFGVGLTEAEAESLFEYFDKDKSGSINYDEFIFSIRGKMNNFRRALVNQAFDKIDADGSGNLTIDDLRGKYNARNHPDVKAGKKTEDQVLHDFLKTFESMYDYHRIDDDQVTRDEFIEYYNFISASCDNDQYFELLMNNTWRINDGADKNWNKKGWGGDYSGSKQAANQNSKQTERALDFGGSPAKSTGFDNQSRSAINDGPSSNIQNVINRVRAKLNSRGAKGYIGMQRQFKIMDDDNDKAINFNEFAKAMRDFGCGLNENETKLLFREFDRDNSNHLSIDEFIRGVRGEMNQFRKNLVTKCFKLLDKSGDGILKINDIKGHYNARNHPDVKSGKKTEDEILGEFLETFEAHHNIRSGYKDQKVTLEEFNEYYNNISANIDNDQYFENLIVNAYKLYQYDQKYMEYAPANYQAKKFATTGGRSGVYTNAPFGVTQGSTDYGTTSRPQTAQSYSQPTRQNNQPLSDENLLNAFRNRILARGVRGMTGLSKNFRIVDDNNSHTLEVSEFHKCCRDFRVDITDDEVKRLFKLFDLDGSGTIDYDEFLRAVRGPMNQNRVKLVKLAFQKLDKDGSGNLTIDDVRAYYNAKNHPDVRTGKKSEEEVLGDFLDTFEQHHAIATGDFKLRDKNVSWEEFLEYYNNVSASVDDDRYFELMIKNAWNLDNVSYQKAWRGDYRSGI
eukprot:CAMPEP_0114594122 /NCGR_PEP_ID=MMETSP0125-20121206/15747_1 /TAXON_ID=485358 ORGANISM="Aristerostoma sp., Strain ATCC 50986" /NCGR_SAMPLE_ID=MMETSP0125 /ASSEMBLY_ACC=CAM_ASM_000245 /LENGTH=722 /DNA_ID=CAMNT_0001794047 /DNA_START=327 /DNA_END=2495 /DNA_ORIENTATION=+